MEQKPEFKRNLWGYKKEAVLKYIDEMSKSAQQSEAELQQKIEQITHSREELESQIADFEQKLQSIEGDLDSEKGKNKKLSDMIGLLQEEIDRQRRRSDAREREYHAVQEHNHELQEQIRKNDSKKQKYDEAAASIGSAILEAQQKAKTIIDDANNQAEGISRETEIFVSSVLEKIEGMQSDFLALKDKMNKSVDLLNDRFNQIESDIYHAKKLVLNAAEEMIKQQPLE